MSELISLNGKFNTSNYNMHNVGQLSSYNTYNWVPLTSEFKIKYNNIKKQIIFLNLHIQI